MAEKPYHAGALKEKLLHAALDRLAAGETDLSLRAVARQVGVTPMAAYRHFRLKEDLLAAVAEQGFRRLLQSFEAPGAAAENPQARLQRHARHYLEFAAEHPGLLKLMFGTEIRDRSRYPTLAFFSRQCFARLQDIVAQIPGRRLPAAQGAVMAWALVHGYAQLQRANLLTFLDARDRPTAEALANAIFDALQ